MLVSDRNPTGERSCLAIRPIDKVKIAWRLNFAHESTTLIIKIMYDTDWL